MESDRDLVKRVQNSDEKAFELLFNRYYEKLYYFAYRYMQNKQDAEGIVQELFTKIWLNRSKLDTEQSFNAYLFTIARNSIFNQFRSQKYRRAYKEYVRHFIDYAHRKSEEDVLYADLLRYIDEVVDTLPEKRRKIFIMSRKQGMAYKDIAAEMQISEKTVETHMRLALQALRAVLRNQSILPAFFIPFFLQ